MDDLGSHITSILMKTITLDGSEDSFENGLIQSLCYFYAGTLKNGFNRLADDIEAMLEKCVQVIGARGTMPAESEDTLKLFLILRNYRCLSSSEKQALLQLLETLEEERGRC
jgi:hypothetical protein